MRAFLPNLRLSRLLQSALLVLCALSCRSIHAATALGAPTVTTLSITNQDGTPAANISTLTAVTITVKVMISETSIPVFPGRIQLCDATAAFCSDIHLLATVQLQAGGVATYVFVPGPGSHSYKAIFTGTTTYAPSSSTSASLTVAGKLIPNGLFTATGPRGNYTLNAPVYGAGTSAPTGTVYFSDHGSLGKYPGIINPALGQAQLVPNPPGFHLPSPGAFDNGAEAVAVADFNNDGIPDRFAAYTITQPGVQTCNSTVPDDNHDLLEGYAGDPEGLSEEIVYWPVPVECATTSIAVGDFNNDGNVDLIVGSSSSGPAKAALTLVINGKEGFTPSNTLTTQSGIYGEIVAVADLNLDGNADIIGVTSGQLYVGLGDGNGNFTAKTTQIPSDSFFSVAVGDFNGDGIPDVALPDYNKGTVLLLFGVGDGTFVTSTSSPTIDNPVSIATADLNGDGNPDLIVTSSSAQLIVLVGDGAGGFTPWPTLVLPTSSAPFTGPVAVADFNGDGNADIIAGENVLLGNGSGTFTLGAVSALQLANPEPGINSTVTADLNLDGLPDVISSGNTILYASTQSSAATATSISPQPPGSDSHYVVALYEGDSNYVAEGQFPYLPLATAMGTTTFTLFVPPNPVAAGTTITFEAILGGGGDTPSGTVSFYSGNNLLGSATLPSSPNSASAAYFSTTSIPAGTYSITASYSGDTNYPPATSTAQTLTVYALPSPTITLTASSASVQYGSPVTLTSTLTGSVGTPTGVVTFYNGITSLGSAILNGNGVASLTTSATSLPIGTDAITATYPGNAQYSSVTSSPTNIVVGKTTPSIAITSSANSAAYGSPLTITATITFPGVPPTGNITLYDGSTSIASLTPNNGVVSFIDSKFTVGSHSLSAAYSGDSNYSAATSTPVTITISALTPSITLSPEAASISVNSSFTMTSTVTDSQGPTPTGTVKFFDGATLLGSTRLAANGSAAFTTSSFTVGTHSVTADYSGDSVYAPVISQSSSITVTSPPTITPTTFYVGSSNVINITVPSSPGGPAPTGTITLSATGYTSTATPLTAGSTSITIPANTLQVGIDFLTAAYSGDSVYPAASSSVQIVVTATPPGFAVTANAVTIAAGATTGNTAPITIAPQTGFTGSVSLTAAISSSPSGAVHLPTLSFGSTSPVVISGTAPGTATLTITTTAATTSAAITAQSSHPNHGTWYGSGGIALAALGLLGIPARRRSRKLCGILLFVVCAGALSSCGGSGSGGNTGPTTNPGTTPGAYQIKITATSGPVTTDISVSLTVQ